MKSLRGKKKSDLLRQTPASSNDKYILDIILCSILIFNQHTLFPVSVHSPTYWISAENFSTIPIKPKVLDIFLTYIRRIYQRGRPPHSSWQCDSNFTIIMCTNTGWRSFSDSTTVTTRDSFFVYRTSTVKSKVWFRWQQDSRCPSTQKHPQGPGAFPVHVR